MRRSSSLNTSVNETFKGGESALGGGGSGLDECKVFKAALFRSLYLHGPVIVAPLMFPARSMVNATWTLPSLPNTLALYG